MSFPFPRTIGICIRLALLAALVACDSEREIEGTLRGPSPAPSTGIRHLLDRLTPEQIQGGLYFSTVADIHSPLSTLDLEGEVKGDAVYRLPVPSAREEVLLNQSGRTTPLAVLAARQSVLCADLAVFADFGQRVDASGMRRVLVSRPCEVSLPLERVGVAERWVLHVELLLPDVLQDLEASDLPELTLHQGDAEVGRLQWGARSSGAQPLAVDLPADLGSQELVLKVARVGSGSQDLQVLLRDIHRQFLDLQDRVRVPQQLLSTTAEVQFLPAAPRSVRRLDSAGGRVLEADVLLLGGEVSVKSSSPQPFRVRVDGQVVATAGAAHQAVWKVAEPRLSRLQIEAGFGDLHGSFWLLQPAALQYRGPSELRSGEGKPWRAAEVQSISIEESTRSSLLLPAGAEVRLPARFREGDRLELAAAAIDGGGASLGGNQIAFEILWQPAAGTLQKIGQARLELGKAWKELRLAVPSACLGEGELLLKARSLAADRAFHLLLLAVAEPRIVAPRPAEAPPNLLIYLIDTLRADHLGCYGYPRPTSPAIDELAADGALFERAYAQASWTKPSVASLFCGLLASFHGVDKETALANELTTLAERLRSTGYHTAAYVANPYVHLRGLQFEQGFSNFVAVSAGARSPRADDVHRRALPWLEQNGDRPFFLYLHTIDPHETYDPPEETRGTFQRPYEGDLQPQGTYARMLRKRRECNDADLQFLLDLYDEEILFSDREFGRLVEFLRQQGLYDNTVIVLLSDHGEEFLEHGGFGHGGRLWNELLHVPLIIKPAGQTLPRGSRIAANVPLTSVLPSLPGLLGRGLGLPPLQGVDLLPWWRGERSESIDVIAEHGQELRCLIRGSQKVLERGTFGAKDSEVLWFDLLQDPGEQADLFALQPAVGRALQAALYESLENDRQRGVPRAQSEAVDLSKEQEDALRALGYLEQ